jgi:uncharacterized protein YkwD
MLSPAFLTIGKLLMLGLGTLSPSVAVQPTIAATSVIGCAPLTTDDGKGVVRDYASIAYTQYPLSMQANSSAISTIELTSEENALIDDTNRDRVSQGLPDLLLDPLLCLVARSHSADMARRNYFDHMAPGPGPSSPMDRYLAALPSRPDYAFLGENIYYRSMTDSEDVGATEANNAFMRSPGHRANILQPKFTKMGVGFYRDPTTGAFWVTEEFLGDQE